MRGAHRIRILGAAAAMPLIALMLAPHTIAQPAPMPLLTDTPQYCAELSDEVEEVRQSLVSPAPPEVEQLAEEGRRLCAMGEIRGGIVRLRRAMVLLREISGQT